MTINPNCLCSDQPHGFFFIRSSGLALGHKNPDKQVHVWTSQIIGWGPQLLIEIIRGYFGKKPIDLSDLPRRKTRLITKKRVSGITFEWRALWTDRADSKRRHTASQSTGLYKRGEVTPWQPEAVLIRSRGLARFLFLTTFFRGLWTAVSNPPAVRILRFKNLFFT